MGIAQDSKSVTLEAIRSVKWSAFAEMLSRISQPIIQLVLARLLAPEDFGLVAIAIIMINFSQILWDAGLAKALIQTKERIDDTANIVFWVNGALGLAVYIILLIAAPAIAKFYSTPAATPILRVMGIQIVLLSLTSVQQALMARGLDFRKLFGIRMIVAVVPALFSIPLAIAGFRAWALVVGTLVGSFINLMLFWARSSWRPSSTFNLQLASRLFRFGAWVIGEGLIGWFMMYGDNVIVGKYLGVKELGIYQLGWTIVLVIFGTVLNPFLPVLYPAVSRLQDDIGAIKHVFLEANRVVFSLVIPIGVGLLLLSDDIGRLLGDKWDGIGLVIGVIGLLQAVSWLTSINPEFYRAMGRPDINMKLAFGLFLYYLPAFLVGAHYGFRVFVLMRLAVALVALPINVYLCTRLMGVSRWYIWQQGRPMIFAAIAMAASVLVFRWLFAPRLSMGILVVLIQIGVGVATYAIALWALDKPFVFKTLHLVKAAVS